MCTSTQWPARSLLGHPVAEQCLLSVIPHVSVLTGNGNHSLDTYSLMPPNLLGVFLQCFPCSFPEKLTCHSPIFQLLPRSKIFLRILGEAELSQLLLKLCPEQPCLQEVSFHLSMEFFTPLPFPSTCCWWILEPYDKQLLKKLIHLFKMRW